MERGSNFLCHNRVCVMCFKYSKCAITIAVCLVNFYVYFLLLYIYFFYCYSQNENLPRACLIKFIFIAKMSRCEKVGRTKISQISNLFARIVCVCKRISYSSRKSLNQANDLHDDDVVA